MSEERDLAEVYNRRLSKTRDPELKWLLQELGSEIDRQRSANRIAYLHASQVFDEWTRMGLLKPKEEGDK